VEQPHAEPLLEARDCVAQRRGRRAERRGGAPEAPVLGDRDDGGQLGIAAGRDCSILLISSSQIIAILSRVERA